MPVMTDQPVPVQPDDAHEAARMLRALVAAVPPQDAPERATARRLEGAAVALGTLAEMPSGDR